jgi:GT2 family glycosyltransferase
MVSSPPQAEKPVLEFRNGFLDTASVGSNTVFEGSDTRAPLVTLAIATYKRPDYLIEAMESALAQSFDGPMEITVVDNDPESRCVDLLLERFPELRQRNFRYIVSHENIGPWGNFNRCIMSARGEWLTILQDDDLLDANYLQLMFDAIAGDPQIDGIVCRKRFFDQREPLPDMKNYYSAHWVQPMSREVLRSYMANGPMRRELAKRLGSRLWLEIRGPALLDRLRRTRVRILSHSLFRGKDTRKIPVGKFFWGPILGNHGGFIFRTEAVREIGGFYAEDGAGADIWLSARFAIRHDLRQHKDMAASIRVAHNWSAQDSAFLSVMRGVHRMQLALAGTWVPRSWLKLTPLINARFNNEWQGGYRMNVPRATVEQAISSRIGKDRPRLLWLIRFVLGGHYPDVIPPDPNRKSD